MGAGKYNHRIKILTESKEKNAYGELIVTHKNSFKRWASINPKSGGNHFISSAHSDSTTHEIELRFDRRITTKCKMVFKGRTFEIDVALNIDEANHTLILICTERF